jgi:hypothetical protein
MILQGIIIYLSVDRRSTRYVYPSLKFTSCFVDGVAFAVEGGVL